ncbi:cyclic pyranopterin monophosphate synthase MoaC [Bacillus sp. JJ722]|uniref:cyclic pyranopterin monophosphate synthase MoaC n=1 Tax=Bacillus sp. JJ722 TaxID=3122973 RepID=UPI003F68B28F
MKIRKDMFDQIIFSHWKRGMIFSVAKAAGMMACKNTSSKSPVNHLNQLIISK